MSSKELQELVSTYIYAIDFQSVIDDVADFIQMSEQAAEDHYQRELEIESRTTYTNAPPGYRKHMLENLDFRFHVSLAARLRYAAIVAVVTSVEWAVKSLNAIAKKPIQATDKRRNQTVQLLRVLSQQSGVTIDDAITTFEDLVQVRNCIAHDSGLTESFKHKLQLRAAVQRLGPGFSLSSFNFMGEQVWVEKGAIEALIQTLKHAVVLLHRVMHEKQLLRGAA